MVSKKPAIAVLQPANLSISQMQEAIPRLERRLKELKDFPTVGNTIDQISEITSALEKKYEDTLIEIFGSNSLEYQRYRSYGFYEPVGNSSFEFGGYSRSYAEELEPFKKGVSTAARNIQTIIEIFNEKIGDSSAPAASPVRSLENLHLHPQIADASVDLFKGGHYANAVEDACKVLDLLVKMKSKRSDLSGTELMQVAFSPKNPLLKFNEQQNESEKSEQSGMMFLYSGAMLAFRNPRAHGLITDDPIEALEIIGFVNFLAKSLDRSRRN